MPPHICFYQGKQRWLKPSQITGVHPACAVIARRVTAALPLLRSHDPRRVLAEQAFRTQMIPVVAFNKQHLCVGSFHMYGAAKRVPENKKVRVMVYDDVTDEKVREICLSYLAGELLCHMASAPKYVGALWKILPSEYRSILFPGIKNRSSLARAMNVSYATVFPTERKNESDIDGEMQGDLDLGIGDNSKTGEQT